VTDRLEPEIREIFSSALLISEKCSDVSGFLFKSFFVSKFASFDSKKVKYLDSKEKSAILIICFSPFHPPTIFPQTQAHTQRQRNRSRREGLSLAPKK